MTIHSSAYTNGFRINRFKKITSAITLVFFLLQTITAAVANTLDAYTIQADLDSSVEFERVTNGSYQYDAAAYLGATVPAGTWNIESFYKRLRDDYLPALGAPTYVPIMVGDITTILPIYDNPKLVGSSFVQSRYVRSQIHNLLGRHLIDSDQAAYASETAQLATLYNKAFDYAMASNTIYGTPLAVSREDAPTDMIWPERRVINGETVIVPIVYLSAATVLAYKVDDHDVQFNGTVNFSNITVDGVTIKTGRQAFINVANQLTLNGGAIESAGELQIVAGGTLTLLSSVIQAKGDLVIGAHSVLAQTIVHRFDLGHEQGGHFGEVTSIESINGDVTVRSYSDIILAGAEVIAAGDIRFGADGNIYVGPVSIASAFKGREGRWRVNRSSVEYLASSLTAGESIELIASGEILIDAAEIVAGNGHIEILAGLGITIEDELSQFQEHKKGKFGKTKKEISAYKTVAMRSLLDAGKDIRIHSEYGDITLKAVEISSTESTSVTAANGAINLLVTKETDHYSYSSVKKSLFTTKTRTRGHNIETIVPTTIVGGFKAQALYGLNVEYEGDKSLTFDEQVAELSKFKGLEWMATVQQDHPDAQWTEVIAKYETWRTSTTSLSAAAMAVITIAVAVATGPGAGAITSVTDAAFYAGMTSMVTTATIAATNAALNGGDLLDIHKAAFEAVTSDDSLKSVAIAMVTAGALEAIDADFFKATEKMNAQASTIATDSVLWELGGEGLLELSFVGQASQALTHAAVQVTVSTVANGGSFDDFDESFMQVLAQNGVNQLGEYMAEKIGKAFDYGGDLKTALKYISHAGAGCVIGLATAENSEEGSSESACVTGAGGAVVGEYIASTYREGAEVTEAKEALDSFMESQGEYIVWLKEEHGYTDTQVLQLLKRTTNLDYYTGQVELLGQKGVDLAKFGAAVGAFIGGADANNINIAADAGENAAENNAAFGLLYLGEMLIAGIASLGAGLAADKVADLLADLELDITFEDLQDNTKTEEEVFTRQLTKDEILVNLKPGQMYVRENGDVLARTPDGYEWKTRLDSGVNLDKFVVVDVDILKDNILSNPIQERLSDGTYERPAEEIDYTNNVLIRLMHEQNPDWDVFVNPTIDDAWVNGVVTGSDIPNEIWLDNIYFSEEHEDTEYGNINEDGTFSNLFPNDNVALEAVPRTLVQDEDGRYWLQSPNGSLITPSGGYDFVTMPNGTIIIARPNTNENDSTHLGLSNGSSVSYAGEIIFSNNTSSNRGSILEWNNESGHYRPAESFSGNAGLPLDGFINF